MLWLGILCNTDEGIYLFLQSFLCISFHFKGNPGKEGSRQDPKRNSMEENCWPSTDGISKFFFGIPALSIYFKCVCIVTYIVAKFKKRE